MEKNSKPTLKIKQVWIGSFDSLYLVMIEVLKLEKNRVHYHMWHSNGAVFKNHSAKRYRTKQQIKDMEYRGVEERLDTMIPVTSQEQKNCIINLWKRPKSSK